MVRKVGSGNVQRPHPKRASVLRRASGHEDVAAPRGTRVSSMLKHAAYYLKLTLCLPLFFRRDRVGCGMRIRLQSLVFRGHRHIGRHLMA